MSALVSRVFMNGNSQAVRIPQAFRLDTGRVEISRNGQGDLVIHPLAANRGPVLLEVLFGLGEEFATLLEEDRRHQPPLQDRERL